MAGAKGRVRTLVETREFPRGWHAEDEVECAEPGTGVARFSQRADDAHPASKIRLEMHWTYRAGQQIVFPARPFIDKPNPGIVGLQSARRRFGAVLELRVWRRLRADPIRVALDTAPARRRLQHSDLDAVLLVPRAVLDRSGGSGFARGRPVRRHRTAVSRGGHAVEFRIQPPDGTERRRRDRRIGAALRRAAGGDAARRAASLLAVLRH